MIDTIFHFFKRLDIYLASIYFPSTPGVFEKLIASLGLTSFCVLVLLVTEASVVIFGGRNSLWVAFINIVAIGITFLLCQVIKLLVLRLRPHDDLPGLMPLIGSPDKYSFPSSHAAGTFCIAMSIGFFYRSAIPLVFLVAFIISISRFFAKLHYPSDILAGAVIGVLVALIVSSIGQTMLIG